MMLWFPSKAQVLSVNLGIDGEFSKKSAIYETVEVIGDRDEKKRLYFD